MSNLRQICLSALIACAAALGPQSLSAADLSHNPQLLAAARQANEVYQRNIAAAIKALTAEELAARLQAISWLGRSNDPAVVPALLPMINPDTQPREVVREGILALTWMGVDISPQLRQITQRHPDLEDIAYNGLARIERWGSEDWKARADAEDDAIRASAVTNLGNDIAHNAGEILAEAMLTDSDPHIRRMATISLGKLADASYGPQLSRALTDPNPRVRRYAAEALASLNYTEAVPNILMAMQSNVASNYLNRALIAISGEDFGFDHRASLVVRQDAIEKAFVWYTAQQR